MKNMFGENVIDEFRGDYYFLSNFYKAPMLVKGFGFPEIVLDYGCWVETVEHAFQASKTVLFDEFPKIIWASTPAEAKRLGKLVTLRPDWEQKKDQFMYDLVKLKFETHSKLLKLLQETGDAALIEGNNWGDTYWGVCNGVGKNRLGVILMNVRSALTNPDTPSRLPV